ncbi:MAG: hypothetical protein K8R88_05660 [Armatimonadetes bacterium]|nr:hypothetical protein [Armatimonadota bacterium]
MKKFVIVAGLCLLVFGVTQQDKNTKWEIKLTDFERQQNREEQRILDSATCFWGLRLIPLSRRVPGGPLVESVGFVYREQVSEKPKREEVRKPH